LAIVTALLSWSGTIALVAPPKKVNARALLAVKSASFCVRVASAYV
jgi:hypothetical protein